MDAETSANPYAYTEATTAAAPEASVDRRTSTQLTVLAALLLAMGGWGVLVNPVVGAGLLIQSLVVVAPAAAQGDDRQQEIQRQIQANNDRLLPVTLVSLAANFLLSVPMIVGAVGLLKRREWARALTVRTIWANLVVAVLELIFGAVALYLQYAIVLGYVEELSATAPFGDQARIFAYVLVVVQVIVMLAMYGAEFAVYVFGLKFLRKDDVRARFA